MKETPVSGFILFGTVLRYLQDAQQGWTVKGSTRIVGNLKAFFSELERLELTTTRILAEREGLPALLEEFEKPDCERLSKDQATRLRSTMNLVRKTLNAEASEKKAFVASPKRGWDVDRLLNEPSSVFAHGVFSALGEIARYDFQEACRCLAFERPTAAAFHTLRGTEAVLRDYYCAIVKQRRLQRTSGSGTPWWSSCGNDASRPLASCLTRWIRFAGTTVIPRNTRKPFMTWTKPKT